MYPVYSMLNIANLGFSDYVLFSQIRSQLLLYNKKLLLNFITYACFCTNDWLLAYCASWLSSNVTVLLTWSGYMDNWMNGNKLLLQHHTSSLCHSYVCEVFKLTFFYVTTSVKIHKFRNDMHTTRKQILSSHYPESQIN